MQVQWAPRINITARTGWHVDRLVPALEKALEGWETRVGTGALNTFLGRLVAEHPHPVRSGKQPKIMFGTQADHGAADVRPVHLRQARRVLRALHRAPPARGVRLRRHPDRDPAAGAREAQALSPAGTADRAAEGSAPLGGPVLSVAGPGGGPELSVARPSVGEWNPHTTDLSAERRDLLDLLGTHRGFLRHAVSGVSDEQAATRPTVSELCLGGLLKHVTATESSWADFVVNGPAPQPDWASIDWSRPSSRGPRLPRGVPDDRRGHRRRAPRGVRRGGRGHRRPGGHRRPRPRPPAAGRPLARARARPGRRGGPSCTSSRRPPSTPGTPTSSARPSTGRRRWAEPRTSGHSRAPGVRSPA